jgi:transcriptional regulator with XRE-family HTH domain
MTTFERLLYQQIGQRLQHARHRAGLTQQDASEFLRLHRVTLARIEGGAQTISAVFLYRAARLYGCTVKSLLPRSLEP